MWIEDFKPNRLQHNEYVAVYCMNKEKKCGYPVATQCIDGTLKIPECFEGKDYTLTYMFGRPKIIFFKKDQNY